ncbi:hypothetical protein DIPPA_00038 [Diplonema papillatum]|nr:hypothetical protein DIPPA_00038 [Diplonema papillatum]
MHTGADTDDRGAWDAGTSSPASLAQCRGRTLLWAAEELDLQFLKGRGDAAHIVLVGCDGREGTTIREVRACLQEVIDHAASVEAPSLLLTLVGPHVPAH